MLIQILLQFLQAEKKQPLQKMILLALGFTMLFLLVLENLMKHQDLLYIEVRIIFSLGILVVFSLSFFYKTIQKYLLTINQIILYAYSALLIFLAFIHGFSYYYTSLLLSGIIIFSLFFDEIKQLIVYQITIFILLIQASFLSTNPHVDIYTFIIFYVFIQTTICFIKLKMITQKQTVHEMNKKLVALSTKLQDSNKDLEYFAYIASHDLKEPIRTVHSYLQLLKKNLNTQKYQNTEELINIALDSNKRMQNMIDGLLKYAKIGTQKIYLSPVNLNELISQVCSNLEIAIAESNASIEFEDLGTLNVDALLCTQLFQNLISNAIKYKNKEYPKIKITSIHEQFKYTICVSDNGKGIPSEGIQKIFEIFQQGQHDKENGTGIGLATCKKIMELHRGHIWVESSDGFGSDFYVTFPLIE